MTTDNQHPGGVAGQVIDETKNARDGRVFGTESWGRIHSEYRGIAHLHRELSREARAILGEYDERISREDDLETQVILSRKRDAVHDFAQRIGLDLTQRRNLMTDEQLDILEQIANDATPGPWTIDMEAAYGIRPEDASYILNFDPPTAKELITMLRHERAAHQATQAELDRLHTQREYETQAGRYTIQVLTSAQRLLASLQQDQSDVNARTAELATALDEQHQFLYPDAARAQGEGEDDGRVEMAGSRRNIGISGLRNIVIARVDIRRF